MQKREKQLDDLCQQLRRIPTASVLQPDPDTDSVGVTFDYLGVTYTAYIGAESQTGELLQHDAEDLTMIENIGTISALDLVQFFETLPPLGSITK